MILGGGTEPSFYKDSPALFVGSDVLDFLYSLVLRVIQLFPLWLLKFSCKANLPQSSLSRYTVSFDSKRNETL